MDKVNPDEILKGLESLEDEGGEIKAAINFIELLLNERRRFMSALTTIKNTVELL